MPTNARDVMTTEVVSVAPDMPTQKIARLLLDKGVSAAPVVDTGGAPIGMVSEGDLIGCNVSRADLLRTLCRPVALISGDKDGVAGTGALRPD